MPTLTLPRLVAGRDLATAAVHRLGPLDQQDVVLDARPLVSGTASFAGQIVRSTLVDGAARSLTVVGGPTDFADAVRAAADGLQLSERVHFRADDLQTA